MFKFTERDFLGVKDKLIELDDYIEYLLKIVGQNTERTLFSNTDTSAR